VKKVRSASWQPLSRDRIVECALQLAREGGLAGVSMRRLGRVLGVEPMSLYYHIPSKAALLVLMADRSAPNLPHQDPALPWSDRLIGLLMATYQAALDNPALFSVLATESGHRDAEALCVLETTAADVMGGVLRILQETALPTAQQLPVARGMINLVLGFIVVEVDGAFPPVVQRSTDSQRQACGAHLEEPRDAVGPAGLHQDLHFNLELLIRSVQEYG